MVGQDWGPCYPSTLVARKWRGAFMPAQRLSLLGCGNQQVGGGPEGDGSCLGATHCVARGQGTALLRPQDGGSIVSGWAAQAGLGGWPLSPNRSVWP